jgi:GcrA cell cycle regulator
MPACGAQPLPPRARHGLLHRLSSTLRVDTVYYTTIRYVAITKSLSGELMPESVKNPWSLLRPERPGDHWTEMRLNYLRLRWEQGASAERISQELGGTTGNSILGKVRRLGLSRFRRSRAALGRPVRKRRERDLSRERARVTRPPSRTGQPTLVVHRDDLSPFLFALPGQTVPAWVRDAQPYVDDPDVGTHIPLAQRRSLLDLDTRVCRWPFGDPAASDFFFCGAAALTGKPYCAEHCAQASLPAKHAPRIAPAPSGPPPAPAVANQTGSNGEEPR